MSDEQEAISRDLIQTIGLIVYSTPEDRQRIALAYREAKDVVAGIPKDRGDARPRIVVCFQRSDIYKAANDVAGIGWLLTAMEERVNERDLPDWRKLRKGINKAVELLSQLKPTVH